MGLPPGDEVLLLNAGGAFGEAKHWPREYCVSLALRAADEYGLEVIKRIAAGDDVEIWTNVANHWLKFLASTYRVE